MTPTSPSARPAAASTASDGPAFAGPVDLVAYGEYVAGEVVTFGGRACGDLSRFHLYGAWFCPWWQRVAITRVLAGLEDVVSMSFVDGSRDGRGWAFRPATGPDPVNGFTLLRQAYEATRPGFRGHVSVPVLWDRDTSRILSNDPVTIGLDFAAGTGLYPESLRAAIEELDAWLGPAVTQGAGQARTSATARATLLDAFARLDERLATSRYLLGDQLTEADIRLWVRLVRYDAGPNAQREINPGLDAYPRLWAYARDLYTIPAFRDTTDFAAFSAPGAVLPDWSAPAARP